MFRLFRSLLPKEERFFDFFTTHSEVVVAGAEALREMLNGGDQVPHFHNIVMQRENDADAVTREVLMAIRRTFITPFDRANIKDLITSMDNSIDQMQKTSKGVMLFDVRTFSPHMREMADVIVTASKLVRDAMPLLRSISAEATRLASITEQISQLEGRCDELHDVGLKELYLSEGRKDAMAFIVGNEIYDHLEKVVDRLDDVGKEIHGCVLENV
jgi:predicted phosphate transport protein (TIGR00153 family)